MNKQYDVVLLTQKAYVNPLNPDAYAQNILIEDQLLTAALENKGLRVTRTSWDDQDFDWLNTRFAVFRATWDYFHRFKEFQEWLELRRRHIHFINPYPIIKWNMDKHYLATLQQKGINIPPTLFLESGTVANLQNLLAENQWHKAILKPAIAGGARHTYLIDKTNVTAHQEILRQLLSTESLLLQEYQEQITTKGEVSFMVFGGKYSHAVLKKAQSGDFRVQDDYGGTLHSYSASLIEEQFVERVIAQCVETPVYARVDVMWDNQNQLCLSELEMIEPELWFRKDQHAAPALAKAVLNYINNFTKMEMYHE